VAYTMIALSSPSKDSLVERVGLIGAQGFSAVPNGEAGAVTSNADWTKIRNLIIEESGSSPIMLNNCTGSLIEDVTMRQAKVGMLTLWNCYGVHTLRRVRSEYGRGGGLNIEKCQPTFSLIWDGGAVFVDKAGGGYYATHAKIGNSSASIKLDIRRMEYDKGPWPGTFSVQLYGSPAGVQSAADVAVSGLMGAPVPVRFAGTLKA
jgi:hypothetical protein